MLTLFLLSCSRIASAQNTKQTLNEPTIIVLAGQQAHIVSANLSIETASAEALEASLRKNPYLSWNREHFPGKSGDSEDSLVFTLPINLSSSRDTEIHLGQANILSAKSAAVRTKSDAIVYALTRYYIVLALQEEVLANKQAMIRLMRAATIVKRRREEGKVSGLDQSRIEIEVQLAASMLRETEARARTMSQSLALLLGLEPSQSSFEGSLAPNIARPNAKQPANEAPSLTWLRDAAAQAAQANKTAKKRWYPTLSLSAGLRLGLANETRYGYIAGVSVNLPIFSGNEALRARADAAHKIAQSRIDELHTKTRVERVRASGALRFAQRESEQFSQGTEARIANLLRGMESGYREGQHTLVELLDAQRLHSEVTARRLALAISVKRAELAQRAAQGDFE